MKRIFYLWVAMFAIATLSSVAQVFTSTPSPLQNNAGDVVITFHADKSGVAALTGLPSSTPLYAHIGVYTTKSPSTWAHVVTDWGVNKDVNKFKYISPDTYELSLGNLRSYFGITDPSEVITKVCVIARTASGNAQTKDCFIDVVPDGFQMSLTADCENTVINQATTIRFTVSSTVPADLSLTIDNMPVASAKGATSLVKEYAFNDAGKSWVVKATAVNGSETIEKTIEIVYPLSSPQKNYPGGVPVQGAVKNTDGTVTFCLAAPGKSSVMLVGSWDDYQALNKNVMNYQDYKDVRYFWITVDGLDNTTPYPYYYLVDANIKVADPYARLVLDCYSDKWLSNDVFPERPAYPYDKIDDTMLAVYQGNIDDYDWQCTDFKIPAADDLIIYEMLLRDWTGSDSTDDGTVRKAIDKIPYLKQLGVNAVELMPIMEFNGNNSWGYNTNFYMAPDKSYGSPDDYREFIDLCHQEGIAVILDIVFNQSDGLHPWYQMYPASSNPFYNASAPHAYSVLNDWKQDHPLVKQQWKDAITYWMTAYNVDGFRFDLVKGLGDNASYGGDTEKYNASRVANMKALHDAIKAVKPDGIHINENLAGAQEENEMAADGQLNWSNINNSACQYAMGYASESNLAAFYSSSAGRTWGSTVSYAESHDEQRMGYKQLAYGTGSGSNSTKTNLNTRMKRLGSVAAQMLLTPGPKMIWQFGELGADENTKDANNNNLTDPKKVCWNFLDVPERKALFDTYCELINLRRDNPDLFSQNAVFATTGFQNSVTVTRAIRLTSGDKEVIVFLNPAITSANKTVTSTSTLLSASNHRLVSHSPSFTPVLTGNGSTVSVDVPGHSYAVFATESVFSGVEDIVTDTPSASYTVKGGQGEIFISGEFSSVQVYDLSGQRHDNGTNHNHIALPGGFYIVTVDGTSYKVIVR